MWPVVVSGGGGVRWITGARFATGEPADSSVEVSRPPLSTKTAAIKVITTSAAMRVVITIGSRRGVIAGEASLCAAVALGSRWSARPLQDRAPSRPPPGRYSGHRCRGGPRGRSQREIASASVCGQSALSGAIFIRPSCRPQLAFASNAVIPLVQVSDLIFELAILTLREKSNDLVFAVRFPTTYGWPIIHTLSDAEIAG